MKSAIAQLGDVMQLAFVPADFEAALDHWIKVGAGPFFAMDHVKLEDVRYRGAPADIDFSMVIGYWGDLQVELIRQHNEWYPIERDLPMDFRTRDYVPVNGRSFRREPLGAGWILEHFPARR